MTDPRLAEAGYMKWGGDPCGETFLAPDGLRLVTFEQAVAEIDAQAAPDRESAEA